MKRALVLGGGGTVGIAWITGLSAGLKMAGIDLSRADLIVGTSAGSVCGTHLAAGVDALAVLAASASEGSSSNRTFAAKAPHLEKVLAYWTGLGESTPETRRKLGAMALEAPTIPEHAWIGVIQPLLGAGEWPDKPLLLTAVDALTGELQVWEKSSGVPLHLAVTSSCTVPGLMPPVTIGDRRYVDGGVYSGTNAHLAAGHEQVLIVAPIGPQPDGLGPMADRTMKREIDALRASGSQVSLIVPDAETLAAFGPNLMDASRVPGALQAGFRQGAAAVAALTEVWGA